MSLSLNKRLTTLENTSGSGTGTTTIADVENLQSTLDTKQETLTAGDNITIVDNVISSSGGGSSSFVGFRAVTYPNEGLKSTGTGNISIFFNNTNTLPYSYDTSNLFDTTNGIFTVNTSGYWQLSFKFYIFEGESTQAQTNQLKLIRNGVTTALIITGLYNGQNDEVNTCVPLLVGDQIFIYHFTGLSRYVFDVANNFFEARFIGA